MKILLAVDGSKFSLDAVNCLIEHANWYREKPVCELLYAHPPIPKLPGIGSVVGRKQIERYYQEDADKALAEAKKRLERAGIAYKATLLVGDPAQAIVKHAKAARCDLIMIGTHGRGAAGNLLLGSVATEVLSVANTPVLLVR
jgi:nucleotide-binding universal stress UspA family protein